MNKPDYAELVFGFVYTVGTDAGPVFTVLEKYLKQYRYKTEEFRISDQLRSLDLGISFEGSSQFEKMGALMDAGNKARELANENGILGVMAVNDIASHRLEDEQKRPAAKERIAHVIRSLKRPEEVRLLRHIYRPGFFLIGIADDDDAQLDYLHSEIGLNPKQAESLIKRDQDEDVPFGQRTRETFCLADVFVQRKGEAYKKQLERFVDLVFGHPFKTPSREEHAMFMAYASAARSAQLGRQVGAAIATPEGEVVAVGMNEVPSSRGGPYWEGDVNLEKKTDDHRDHRGDCDSNFKQRDRIVQSVLEKLDGKLLKAQSVLPILKSVISDLNPGASAADLAKMADAQISKVESLLSNESEVSNAVHSSDLRDITEYGRAVHGEMDAILSCARLGIGVKGKHLFVTTFPCHNCTRHIIASGIKRVYYIEPYPKSRARDLHSDAICFDESEAEDTGKIPFLPFVGIGPRRYLDLFSLELSSGHKIQRKNNHGIPTAQDKAVCPPRVPMLPFSYLEREEKLIEEFNEILPRLQGVKDGDSCVEGPLLVKPDEDSSKSE